MHTIMKSKAKFRSLSDPAFRLTGPQASRLQKLVGYYGKPEMGKPWIQRDPDDLWLRVLSQIVVAGNAAPGDTLQHSPAVKEKLGFDRLKKLTPQLRRQRIHSVLRAIGTRYVGKKNKSRKVDAAVHNFEQLVEAGGPVGFFSLVAAKRETEAKVEYLSKKLKFYKKKGCRDTLIDFRLAGDCVALDQRLMKILEGVGAKLQGSLNRHYEEVESELIERVAKPCKLNGGELDRVLFRNYSDIMVRLRCP
jgi:hypothetical protein